MENKNLLFKGRTSIYNSVVIGCLGMSVLFYFVFSLIWGILGFLPNIYTYTFQVIISGLLIYVYLGTIYSYEVYEDCIIRKHYTLIKHNYVRYDNIKITRVCIQGFKEIVVVIYFIFQGKDCREGISINSKQLEKLITYCRQNRIPYVDKTFFGAL